MGNLNSRIDKLENSTGGPPLSPTELEGMMEDINCRWLAGESLESFDELSQHYLQQLYDKDGYRVTMRKPPSPEAIKAKANGTGNLPRF